jgi:hypothetical protein
MASRHPSRRAVTSTKLEIGIERRIDVTHALGEVVAKFLDSRPEDPLRNVQLLQATADGEIIRSLDDCA